MTTSQGSYGAGNIRSGGPFGRTNPRAFGAAELTLPETRGRRCILVHVTIVEISINVVDVGWTIPMSSRDSECYSFRVVC